MNCGDIRYTSDGRKVMVVGRLNSDQHIVQEIFVSGDQEMPSGENFVVTSLHEVPVESWKEKNLRELEAQYSKEKRGWERRIVEARTRVEVAEAKAKERAMALLAFAKNSDDSQLQRLYDFFTGAITHFFLDDYTPEIITADDEKLYQTDRYCGRLKVEGIKLVSLVGRSDGRLDYRLSEYRDGSGRPIRIVPCRSYEEALAEAQKRLDVEAENYVSGQRGTLGLSGWQKIEGIRIPEDALAKHTSERREKVLKNIAKLRDEIGQLEQSLAEDGDQ